MSWMSELDIYKHGECACCKYFHVCRQSINDLFACYNMNVRENTLTIKQLNMLLLGDFVLLDDFLVYDFV